MNLGTQLSIDNNDKLLGVPIPSTRFQGSKQKLLGWIWENIKSYRFSSCLDTFGGTGSVAYLLKLKNKKVDYNDVLKFNYYTGLALIENSRIRLEEEDIEYILKKRTSFKYPTFIQDTFRDIYYYDDENAWLDYVVTNICRIDNKYKRAIAFYALFQSCIIKRPFNLFHRKNLYLRDANVKRKFGNKATWDKPFEHWFRKFAQEINGCIFSNGEKNTAYNKNVFDVQKKYDLVYIDTPYMNKNGISVNYFDFYHFLEGIVNYDDWAEMINQKTKHKKLFSQKTLWDDKNTIYDAFDKLFKKFQNSILVVSYRSEGMPSEHELTDLLKKYKSRIKVARKQYKYVLAKNGCEELLLIGS